MSNPITEKILEIVGSDFENGFTARGTFVLSTLPFVELDFSDRKQKEIVHKEKLFELPSDIEILITRTEEEEQECTEDQLEKIDALEKAMNVPFSHFIKYYEYVSGNEGFDTHQGVKGLQFERVMTIIDDNESQGTTFNYEKLFGITEMSNRDLTNQQQGKETTIDRTRRLLYVTCSRAIDSLAIVLYVDQVDLAYEKVQACGWFKADEIEKVI